MAGMVVCLSVYPPWIKKHLSIGLSGNLRCWQPANCFSVWVCLDFSVINQYNDPAISKLQHLSIYLCSLAIHVHNLDAVCFHVLLMGSQVWKSSKKCPTVL